jgi:hypothetical protein
MFVEPGCFIYIGENPHKQGNNGFGTAVYKRAHNCPTVEASLGFSGWTMSIIQQNPIPLPMGILLITPRTVRFVQNRFGLVCLLPRGTRERNHV